MRVSLGPRLQRCVNAGHAGKLQASRVVVLRYWLDLLALVEPQS